MGTTLFLGRDLSATERARSALNQIGLAIAALPAPSTNRTFMGRLNDLSIRVDAWSLCRTGT